MEGRIENGILVLAGLVILAGCATPRGLPGTSEPADGGTGSTHRVEYPVRCDSCLVVFTTDDGPDGVAVEGFFRRRITIHGGAGRVVTLEISPRRGLVREASISVNGNVVARTSDDDLFGGTGAALTAVLPGRGSRS